MRRPITWTSASAAAHAASVMFSCTRSFRCFTATRASAAICDGLPFSARRRTGRARNGIESPSRNQQSELAPSSTQVPMLIF